MRKRIRVDSSMWFHVRCSKGAHMYALESSAKKDGIAHGARRVCYALEKCSMAKGFCERASIWTAVSHAL